MKYILILFLLLTAIEANTQSLDQAIELLSKSKPEALASFFEPSIEFCINDKTEVLKKDAALLRLNNFLIKVRPTKIESRHKGSSMDAKSNYRVARLITNTENYRLFLYLETAGQTVRIKELRLDKE